MHIFYRQKYGAWELGYRKKRQKYLNFGMNFQSPIGGDYGLQNILHMVLTKWPLCPFFRVLGRRTQASHFISHDITFLAHTASSASHLGVCLALVCKSSHPFWLRIPLPEMDFFYRCLLWWYLISKFSLLVCLFFASSYMYYLWFIVEWLWSEMYSVFCIFADYLCIMLVYGFG